MGLLTAPLSQPLPSGDAQYSMPSAALIGVFAFVMPLLLSVPRKFGHSASKSTMLGFASAFCSVTDTAERFV